MIWRSWSWPVRTHLYPLIPADYVDSFKLPGPGEYSKHDDAQPSLVPFTRRSLTKMASLEFSIFWVEMTCLLRMETRSDSSCPMQIAATRAHRVTRVGHNKQSQCAHYHPLPTCRFIHRIIECNEDYYIRAISHANHPHPSFCSSSCRSRPGALQPITMDPFQSPYYGNKSSTPSRCELYTLVDWLCKIVTTLWSIEFLSRSIWLSYTINLCLWCSSSNLPTHWDIHLLAHPAGDQYHNTPLMNIL